MDVIKPQVTDELADYMDGSGSGAGELYDSEVYEVNNYGPNDNLLVRRDRDRDVPESELKTILMWNDAYGVRTYDIGHGREPFYRYVKQRQVIMCEITQNPLQTLLLHDIVDEIPLSSTR